MPSGARKCGSVRIAAASNSKACARRVAQELSSPMRTVNALTLSSFSGLCFALAITGCATPSASIKAKLTSGISVVAPVDGADVTSPFTVTASATTCATQLVVSMSYSIDGGQAIVEPASFNTQVTTTPGAHLLHVKCLGQSVSSEVLMNINVASSPATTPTTATAATPIFSELSVTYSSAQTVSISSATTGSTIYFTTDGSTPSTSSNRYTGPVTIASSAVLQALAVAPGYTNSGVAKASYVISTPQGPAGPATPSYAITEQEIQLLTKWRIKHDPGTSGTSTGSMTLVSDPSLSGQAAKFLTTFTNAGGELYSVTYGNDTDSKNFLYDAHVWIAAGSTLSNLEMDNNQVMRNGDTVIYAFQCSGYSNTWEFSANIGTPTSPQVKWMKSAAPCNPSKWTRDVWH